MDNALTVKQERAIIELLNQPTIEMAAKAVGVSYVTLYRWINKNPIFSQEYKRMKDKIMESAFGKIQGSSNNAVEVLIDIMNDDTKSASVRANSAKILLELGIKVRDMDFAARIDELERIIKMVKGTVYHFE